MFDSIIRYLESLATVIPLELFVAVGSFIEEVIAPIPSPVTMILAGTLAFAQSKPLIYILPLALFGAFGKTTGAFVLYILGDKLTDVVVGRFGRFLGVTSKSIESFSKRLNGDWRDNLFLFVARMIPVFPSAPVSVACGVIKLNRTTYLTSTFAGIFFRDLMYLYLGYAGFGNYKEMSEGFDRFESLGQLLLLLLISGVILWAYYKKWKLEKG